MTCCHPQSGPYLQFVAEHRGGVELLLHQTTDPELSKNRMHLDLRTPDLDAEVHRLVDLGAKIVTDAAMVEHDWHWHVVADPDGNEFCLLQPPAHFPWPAPS